MKAILIDDESNNRYVLRSILERYYPDVNICGEAENASQAYDLIQLHDPDLIFLDIQMPQEDGFQLLRKFAEINFEVIFVTSFDKYAIDAIKFSALDYLLKPVDLHDMQLAMERARKRISAKANTTNQVSNLLNDLEGKLPKKIMVHDRDNVVLLPVSDIESITGDGSYSNIRSTDGNTYIVSKYLKDFESYFGSGSDFIRISKSQIINARQIRQYSKGEPCMITLNGGEVVEVSRRKKTEVLAALGKFQ